MRAGSDRCHPWAGVGNRADIGAIIACRGGDEYACIRGKEKSDFDRIHETGQRTADREVDDVNAIRHGLINGRNAVGGGATAAGPGLPTNLVGRNPSARRHAAD